MVVNSCKVDANIPIHQTDGELDNALFPKRFIKDDFHLYPFRGKLTRNGICVKHCAPKVYFQFLKTDGQAWRRQQNEQRRPIGRSVQNMFR